MIVRILNGECVQGIEGGYGRSAALETCLSIESVLLCIHCPQEQIDRLKILRSY